MSKTENKIDAEKEWKAQALSDGLQRIVYSVDPVRFFVYFPYAKTVADVLVEDFSDYHAEAKSNGFVIAHQDDEEFLEDLGEYLKYQEFVFSPDAEALMQGTDESDDILQERATKAKKKGYTVPSLWPTERTLKDHQVPAVLTLASSTGTILADDVGLGKGSEFIGGLLAAAQWRIQENGEKEEDCFPFLVVTNASLKAEISEEIAKWKNDAKIFVLQGRTSTPIPEGTEFIVTNNNILKDWEDEIIAADIQGFVVDESQSMNSLTSGRFKSMKKIADKMRKNDGNKTTRSIMASATPFQNGPFELWNQLYLIGHAPKYANYAEKKVEEEGKPLRVKIKDGYRGGTKTIPLSEKMFFESRWCDGQTDSFHTWNNRGATNSIEMNRMMLENSMIRRKKSDVLSPLPELHQNFIYYDLEGEDLLRYKTVEKEYVDYMMDKTADSYDEEVMINRALRVLERKLEKAEAMMRLSELRKTLGEIKARESVKWIKKFFDTEEITNGDPNRDKLIVFCHHKEAQDILVNDPELQKYGLVSITYQTTGSMKKIQEAKRQFQTDPNTKLIICNSGAQAGHTLTAAYDTLIVESIYGPIAYMQMVGRNWARFSAEYAPHEAYVHSLMAVSSIDEVIAHSNVIRRSMMSSYIDGDDIDENVIKEKSLSLAEREKLASYMMEAVRTGTASLELS